MKIRLATAASAFAMAAAVSAPALANEQAALVATGTSIVVSAAEAQSDLGVVDAAMAADAATPVVITASSATTGTASTTALALDSAAVTAAVQAATPASEKRSESFTVVLNQDSFFGFYPTFNALIPVGENVDLSVYGILWTTPDFSTNGGGGDLWTEFGIGANFYAMDGALTIKPQIGILNGALLSGGAAGGTGGNVFDGVVPNLTMNYSDDAFEAEFYGGYYAAARNRNSSGLDFLHTWINAGYKFTSNFSAGAHYEILSLTRNSNPGGGASNVYQWVGPYVQFSLDNGFFTRFTAGAEMGGGVAGNNGDFYKLAVGFSF